MSIQIQSMWYKSVLVLLSIILIINPHSSLSISADAPELNTEENRFSEKWQVGDSWTNRAEILDFPYSNNSSIDYRNVSSQYVITDHVFYDGKPSFQVKENSNWYHYYSENDFSLIGIESITQNPNLTRKITISDGLPYRNFADFTEGLHNITYQSEERSYVNVYDGNNYTSIEEVLRIEQVNITREMFNTNSFSFDTYKVDSRGLMYSLTMTGYSNGELTSVGSLNITYFGNMTGYEMVSKQRNILLNDTYEVRALFRMNESLPFQTSDWYSVDYGLKVGQMTHYYLNVTSSTTETINETRYDEAYYDIVPISPIKSGIIEFNNSYYQSLEQDLSSNSPLVQDVMNLYVLSGIVCLVTINKWVRLRKN